MIKINISDEIAARDLHYKNVVEKKGRAETVADRLEKSWKKDKRNASLYRYLNSKVILDSSGFSIITAKPDQLILFAEDFARKFPALSRIVKTRLEWIFYYNDHDKWHAYELANQLGINVCPYCNRSYTFTLGNDVNKGTRFEFDHFFHQSKYPYLALSFYNLIPSCHICNSNLKGSEQFGLSSHIHPYLDGFGENILFSIKPKNIGFINGKANSYRIRFRKGKTSTWNSEKVKAAMRNIVIFRLTQLYNMHKDYVDELILKSIIYNKSYIDSLYNSFKGTLFKNKQDVNRMVLGNYTDETDYHRRVLSKLTTDISRELDLL